MRGDDWHNASSPEDEAFASCLLEGIDRFFLDLRSTPINKRILSYAAADYPVKKLLRFGEGRKGLSIMPVDDGKLQRIQEREVNVTSVQMEKITP